MHAYIYVSITHNLQEKTASHLVKDNSLVAVEEQLSLSIPPNSSSQHLALDIGPFRSQLLGTHGVVYASNALLNDGALVQVGRDEMGRSTDNLDAAVVGLVVGLGALEGGQEAVVDVDDAAGHGLAQRGRQDLHVAGEDDELDAVLLDELEHLRLLLGLGLLGDGQVVELDAVALGEGAVLGVVGDDDGHLDVQLARLHAEEQVVEAVANLGHHDEHAHLARHRPNVPRHLVLRGERRKRRHEVLGRFGRRGAKVHAHEEALRDGVGELLQVENVVLVGCENARHCVHDARLVGARQREDVVVGHVE